MKKVIISICLTMSIIFVQLTCSASVVCNTHAEFLNKIGIVKEIKEDGEFITRSETVMMGVSIIDEPTLDGPLSKKCIPNNISALSDLYIDMNPDRADYYFFENLRIGSDEYGQRIGCSYIYLPIIQGYDRRMRPDDYITWPEFVTFFIRLLDWDAFMYLDGDMTYPNAYIEMANKIGWQTKDNGYVTFSEACDFVYDVIQTHFIYYARFGPESNAPYAISDHSILDICRTDTECGGFLECVDIQTEDEDIQFKQEYSIEEPLNFVGKKVVVANHIVYVTENPKKIKVVTDAIMLDDWFEYKGKENGIPNEKIAPFLIGAHPYT